MLFHADTTVAKAAKYNYYVVKTYNVHLEGILHKTYKTQNLNACMYVISSDGESDKLNYNQRDCYICFERM